MWSWQSMRGWQYDPSWLDREIHPAAQDQFEEAARTNESNWQRDDWQESGWSHNWQRSGWQEPGWQDKEAVQDQHVESATSSVRQRLGLLTVKPKAGVAGSESDH